jgi:hypothetical protein
VDESVCIIPTFILFGFFRLTDGELVRIIPVFTLLGWKLTVGLTVGISDFIALTFITELALGFKLAKLSRPSNRITAHS